MKSLFSSRRSTKSPRTCLYEWFLGLRGVYKKIIAPERTTNLFHATVQKTGSQWIRSVFSDERMVRCTGLPVYPQHRYEWNEFQDRFPRYTFVPGLYISYPSFEEIIKPEDWKAFYVLRDPRDVVISWYYSTLETHEAMGKVPQHRDVLKQLDFQEGVSYCIRELSLKFQFMRTWAYHSSDPNVMMVRFEDLISEPLAEFGRIFDFCKLEVPDAVLSEVLHDYTKEKMRERDLKRRRHGTKRSHYRRKETDWRSVFADEHRDLFYSITGDLVDILGYPR